MKGGGIAPNACINGGRRRKRKRGGEKGAHKKKIKTLMMSSGVDRKKENWSLETETKIQGNEQTRR